jgi:hypothetical protein
MNEVSTRALGVFFDGLSKRGIPHERLVEGLPVTLAELRGFGQRIDWDLFVQLCERVEEICGGPEGLFRLGHDQFGGSSTFGFMRQVARVFRRPRDLYWMGTVWFGRALFSILEDDFKDLPDKRIREVIRIPPQYRDCPQLFHLMHGSLTAAPSLLRYADAQVDMVLAPREATYLITPPEREKFRRPKLASLTSRFGAWELIETLSGQQDELKENIQGLSTAFAEVSEQLKLVQVIGHELCEQDEVDELARALAGAFEKHLPDRKIALWLQPLDAADETPLLEIAGGPGPPTRTYSLRAGRAVVGRLEVWGGASDTDPRRTDLLEDLVPWIALALDSARSRAALRAAALGPLG